MEDLAGGRHEREIGNLTKTLTMPIHQISINQSRKPLQGELITDRGKPFHKHFLVGDATPLIQTPNIPTVAKGRRTAHPTKQSMHWRMHPSHHTSSMIDTLITTHPVVQQITQQDLIRKLHGDGRSRVSIADLNGHHQIGEACCIIGGCEDRRGGWGIALERDPISFHGFEAIEDIAHIEGNLHSLSSERGR